MIAALVDVNGYGLAALIILAIVFVVAIGIGARLLRPTRFRVARMGVFVERQRFEEPPADPEQTQLHPPDHGWPQPPDQP